MAEKITAPEFAGIVEGGSAAGGHYIFLTIRLGDKNVSALIEKSKVGELMVGLATAAGMARRERVANDPSELEGFGNDAAYALVVADASVGRSADHGSAILDILIDAERGGRMNLFLAAGLPALVKLGKACERAIELLKTSGPPPRRN